MERRPQSSGVPLAHPTGEELTASVSKVEARLGEFVGIFFFFFCYIVTLHSHQLRVKLVEIKEKEVISLLKGNLTFAQCDIHQKCRNLQNTHCSLPVFSLCFLLLTQPLLLAVFVTYHRKLSGDRILPLAKNVFTREVGQDGRSKSRGGGH